MVQRIKRLENYIFEFFSTRFEEIKWYYQTSHRDRKTDVYILENGTQIMDFIIGIHSIVEEQFYARKLIPQKFATPKSLFNALQEFKDYLNENQKLIDPNIDGENTSDVISRLMNIKTELIEMIDYSRNVYDYEEAKVPYQDLRLNLINRDIDEFIKNLKSILSSVSYSISKTKEGYHHSNVHLILKMLGFDVISEEETNIGRIDAVIRFTSIIYIIEFKFDNSGDSSVVALNQIKEKRYYEKFLTKKKDILAIGIGFSDIEKNISGYSHERIE